MVQKPGEGIPGDPEARQAFINSAIAAAAEALTNQATRPDAGTPVSPMHHGDPVHYAPEAQATTAPPDALTDTLEGAGIGDIVEGEGRVIRSHRHPKNPSRLRQIAIGSAGVGSAVAGGYLIYEGLRHLS